MFNAFQWNCFNFVYTCNVALILFLKCDITKFRIPPPLVTQCHTSSTPSPLNVWRNLWMAPKRCKVKCTEGKLLEAELRGGEIEILWRAFHTSTIEMSKLSGGIKDKHGFAATVFENQLLFSPPNQLLAPTNSIGRIVSLQHVLSARLTGNHFHRQLKIPSQPGIIYAIYSNIHNF